MMARLSGNVSNGPLGAPVELEFIFEVER